VPLTAHLDEPPEADLVPDFAQLPTPEAWRMDRADPRDRSDPRRVRNPPAGHRGPEAFA